MFEIIRKSLATGVVTTEYPAAPAELAAQARGRPQINYSAWRDARLAAEACPTGAIGYLDKSGQRETTLDLGLCTYCGLCAEVDPAIVMTRQCEIAVSTRGALQEHARFELARDGTHQRLLDLSTPKETPSPPMGDRLKAAATRIFGRSLHIRQVDAGSCNGCEMEIVALNSPVYDVERFGIHFVASPRHADLLLVTGPVTRNMELALRKTYEATPPPRLVVAVGACGCSGGIFGRNYATCGAVDQVIPVDVYVPGCPPNPHALLHGILKAMGRLEKERHL